MEDNSSPKGLPRRSSSFIEVERSDGTIRKVVDLNDAVRRIVLSMRARYGWSENQVARYVGIPQQTLNTFMNTGNMNLGTFSKLLDPGVAVALNDWLRDNLEEAALLERDRLAALPEGAKKKRGRPRKK